MMGRYRRQSGMGPVLSACRWRPGPIGRARGRGFKIRAGHRYGRRGLRRRPAPGPSLPCRAPGPEAAAGEEAERRARGCRLQYQRASVRFLAPFAAHPLDGGRRLEHLLGPDWLLDVSRLVAPHARVQDPRVASLEGGRVLVGLEPGVTAIEVSAPPRKAQGPGMFAGGWGGARGGA